MLHNLRGRLVATLVVALVAGVGATGAQATPMTNTISKHDAVPIMLTAPLKVTGVLRVDSWIAVSTPGWSPTPQGYYYDWKRSGVSIRNAVQARYMPVVADLGHVITVTVHGYHGDYAAETSRTASLGRVAPGVLQKGSPTVVGTARVGWTLGSNSGLWATWPVKLTYQWKRSGVNISGATRASYRIVSADRGKTLTLTVRGAATGYASAAKTTAPTRVVR